MRITSEESERQKRIGSSRRQPTTGAHSVQLECNTAQESITKHESSVVRAKSDPIKELTAKIEELTNTVETMKQQRQPQSTHVLSQDSQNKSRARKERPYGCPECVKQNRPNCSHCFFCGEEGHRAVGCLKKQKRQGNANPVAAAGQAVIGCKTEPHGEQQKGTQNSGDDREADPQLFNTPAKSATQNRCKRDKSTTQFSFEPASAKREAVAKLIGKKALIQCNLSGLAVTALLDSGAEVSIISRAWKDVHLPDLEIRPMSEIIEEIDELKVYAVNGELIPFDGWVAIMTNLPGNEDPSLSICVPFLVSSLTMDRPLVGFNVLDRGKNFSPSLKCQSLRSGRVGLGLLSR